MIENRQADIDFLMDETAAGFRLHRFELYNWGTFHERIWVLPLDGKNGLLTGEIGSGKSTVVDAITTLLVPPNRVAYNKAAGAEFKERTLRSYVEGFFKSERHENSLARPVSLRGPGTYSVLLGYFHNSGLGLDVTLAQVFWMTDDDSQPSRFYVVSDKKMSISENFTNFGSDMNVLRRNLKSNHTEIFDSFLKYKARFSRAIGIRNDQALNLFHQTVSMKSIGNLTDFVRNHMLESFDAAERIGNLIQHFDDLTRAHDAIVKARKQILMLTPIAEDCAQYFLINNDNVEIELCLAALETYFARFLSELLNKKIRELSAEELILNEKLTGLKSQKADKRRREDELKRAIYDNGGNRIAEISRQIEDKEKELETKKKSFVQYLELIKTIELPNPGNRITFAENRRKITGMHSSLEDVRSDIQNRRVELSAEKKKIHTDLDLIKEELQSLRTRRTNIGSKHIALRDEIALILETDAEHLPFIGELLRVRQDEKAWEGAAERILHNYGLSVLVSDEYYKGVSEWAEKNHIGNRIVYYRVRNGSTRQQHHIPLSNESLVHKLEIKPESPFYDWLSGEIANRFNYVCCDTIEQFRREPKALTCTGQIKSNEKKHEKDDRYLIDDRSRYILGWENSSKIGVLKKEEEKLEAQTKGLAAELAFAEKELSLLNTRAECLAKLSLYDDYERISWRETSIEIERLKKEKKLLLETSEQLRVFEKQLNELQEGLRAIEDKIEKTTRNQQSLEDEHKVAEIDLKDVCLLTSEYLLSLHGPCFEKLDKICISLLPKAEMTDENSKKYERETRLKLTEKRNANIDKAKKLSNVIVRNMGRFCQEYPLDTQEVDADVESASEFIRMLERLKTDDLPRFETKFKKLLKENTIREIAAFHAQLNSEAKDIQDRISKINKALTLIDYVPGRYIKIEAHKETNICIREFQADLKNCTEGALSEVEGDSSSETRFKYVQQIIERFKGRPESAEADKKWTLFVTDVRNWFSFSASERWKETGEEYEHYTDSGGKSGGQKEKLAYTILAASLAYQFGLETTPTTSRTFRMVMIDEAFGRGSDESAQFALGLFKTLYLQLLIVTPLQKIHVIEPYVSRVGFVHNENGKNSCIRNLTIEEYMEEKRARGHVDNS
jgi:uncharacterized protein YPO0396